MEEKVYNSNQSVQNVIRLWVEWKHISMGKTHCPTCLKLDKCWFVKENTPRLPQHEYCHCTAVPKSTVTVQKQVRALCAYEKFARYALDPTNDKNKGKAAMFQSWGYTAVDSKYLMAEYERQAREKYLAGDYVLGLLNVYGQRISIQVTLPRNNGEGTIIFITGWLVEPNGIIRLVTPYGGK